MTLRLLARRACLLFALAGCTEPPGPGFPADARLLIPRPIEYATWWRMVEGCSGVQGNLDAVRWYYVPDGLVVDGQAYNGYWFADGNRIVLGGDHVDAGGTVRHEMIHALLQRGSHPVEYFVTRCGALAPCGTACTLKEADRGVPTDARVVPPESLEVSLALAPAGAPALSIDSGWVTLMVTATNTRPEPVWVTMPRDSVGFGYLRARDAGTFDWVLEPRWAFRAGESRSLAFDFQVTTPGLQDTLWGVFGWARSPAHPIVVGP